MKVYKFRGKEQFEFALDIIINRRLHYAALKDLNDPFEWNFDHGGGKETEQAWDEFYPRVLKYKICSLSKTYNEYLLWVHYASGFRGMAIEIDLPYEEENTDLYKDSDFSPARDLKSELNDNCICSVGYSQDVYMQNSVFPHNDNKYYDADVIYRKAKKMAYEQEIRIVTTTEQEYYQIPETSSMKVIISPLMDVLQQDILKTVCEKHGVKIEKLKNNNNHLESVEI